ncbi:MAG: hypothetical protein HZA27_03380 [Candidatus Omnitrophica bacterium]|nr:hypothetical protein [Candidatus Omnitrophota bacterium]
MNPGKISVVTALVLISLFIFVASYSQSEDPDTLIIFHSPSCHNCLKVKNEVMPKIEHDFKDRVKFTYIDIENIDNYKLLLALKEKYRSDIKIELPVFYFRGHFLNGKADVEKGLVWLIKESLRLPAKQKDELPFIDLVAHFKAIEPLAVVSAGLIDGINPCAFSVIVFFISFLALQGYLKRDLIIIGLIFIFAVFLTYLLIGIGLFGFLYRLKSFWLAAKVFNFSIGIFSIILGIFTLYDFFKFKKTKETEGLLLQLPAAVKKQIQAIIGRHYRKTKDQEIKGNILKLVFSAMITGFLVSILEAVCTGQVYLPTITFVLKATPLKLPALGYLLLYNLMFITPLFAIFLLALLGVTSGQFSSFLKRHLLSVKVLMAILFFGLGIFLLWKG